DRAGGQRVQPARTQRPAAGGNAAGERQADGGELARRRPADVERVRPEGEGKSLAPVGGGAATGRTTALAHGDTRTGAAKQDGRGQAGQSAADDNDMRRFAGSVHPGLLTRSTPRGQKRLRRRRFFRAARSDSIGAWRLCWSFLGGSGSRSPSMVRR